MSEMPTLARHNVRRWGLVLLIAAVAVGGGFASYASLTSPSRATAFKLPPISPQTRGESATFLHGPGAAVVGLQRDVATWLADPRRQTCDVLVAELGDLGTPAGLASVIASSPDPVLADLGADEISLLPNALNQCTRATNNARGRLLMVDAALGQRVAQLHGTR